MEYRSERALLNAANLDYVEAIYEDFLKDPTTVSPEWRTYFAAEEANDALNAHFNATDVTASQPPTSFDSASWSSHDAALSIVLRVSRVYQLVNAYRVRGHLLADLDPLDQREIPAHPELELEFHGFTDQDLATLVPDGGFRCGRTLLPLGDLLKEVRETYCRTLGVEFMYIQDPVQKHWLWERMETCRNRRTLPHEEQGRILEKLTAAETFEQFLHSKYVGTKRFSLEGAEGLIPMLDLLIEHAGEQGVEEIVMGMAHRGRLNVLTNILGQEPSELFAQFEDIDPESILGSGDVKYHMGYSRDYLTRAGQRIHLSLASNPSHLEAVDPVVEGRTRSKQDRRKDSAHHHVMPVLIHGDAAFCGQGLVAEVLNLAQVPGYRTGGTIHIIVNNQIGFTTGPSDARSSLYPSDVAKMTQVPIFHVNGEDAEAIAHVTELAINFRQQFKKDVVIDMFCFRKYGHNESDEPSFTQPLMYKAIEAHPGVRAVCIERMVASRLITRDDAQAISIRERERLERELDKIRSTPRPLAVPWMGGIWTGYVGGKDEEVPQPETSVDREKLHTITDRLTAIPEKFTPHRKIVRLLQQRRQMGLGELPLDWGMGEALAFASILWDGHGVRLSGQDCRRGTFSHRHAVIVDSQSGQHHYPHSHLRSGQGTFSVYDSTLSEAGVLGFEYGYSLDAPDSLVMWEAQFGDFANGAQVIIDQFITSAEYKWKRLSGLVLLLPHGYEGQGPEHSSARLERYLQLCARDNIQVCNATTPAQFFHLLRRQVKRPIRKPLIVMTPKSLLRHPAAISPLSDFTSGRFQRILPESRAVDPTEVRRLLLCSGKVYFDLAEERHRRELQNCPILRFEQLYPYPRLEFIKEIEAFPNLEALEWVQEEPRNKGAWEFMRPWIHELVGSQYRLVGHTRMEGASTATGSAKAHHIETRRLLDSVFGASDAV